MVQSALTGSALKAVNTVPIGSDLAPMVQAAAKASNSNNRHGDEYRGHENDITDILI